MLTQLSISLYFKPIPELIQLKEGRKDHFLLFWSWWDKGELAWFLSWIISLIGFKEQPHKRWGELCTVAQSRTTGQDGDERSIWNRHCLWASCTTAIDITAQWTTFVVNRTRITMRAREWQRGVRNGNTNSPYGGRGGTREACRVREKRVIGKLRGSLHKVSTYFCCCEAEQSTSLPAEIDG